MAQSPLSGLSEAERAQAFERFELLRPVLEEGVPLARVARDRGIALRTARRWAGQYRREGLAGLARKGRSDRGKRHLSDTLRQAIEGLALKKPPLSAASIHRQVVTLAERLGEAPPSYGTVYAVIRDLDPALVTLAHEGTKAYADAFDLIHRHEATGPNAVWQADHTELDIVAERRAWAAREAVADRHPRRLQPRRGGLRAVLRQPLGDPDGPGPAAGDLAQGPTRLAGLRHPRNPLFRPRQRLHVPPPRAGGRRSEDSPGQLRGSDGLAAGGRSSGSSRASPRCSSRGCPATRPPEPPRRRS